MSHKVPFVDYPVHFKSMRGEILPVIDDVLSFVRVHELGGLSDVLSWT